MHFRDLDRLIRVILNIQIEADVGTLPFVLFIVQTLNRGECRDGRCGVQWQSTVIPTGVSVRKTGRGNGMNTPAGFAVGSRPSVKAIHEQEASLP